MGTGAINGLDGLLASSFDDGGLRRFMAQLPQGDELLAELPGPNGTALAEVAFAAATLLRKRAMVEVALDRLLIERPQRCSDIERVRAQIPPVTELAPSQPSPNETQPAELQAVSKDEVGFEPNDNTKKSIERPVNLPANLPEILRSYAESSEDVVNILNALTVRDVELQNASSYQTNRRIGIVLSGSLSFLCISGAVLALILNGPVVISAAAIAVGGALGAGCVSLASRERIRPSELMGRKPEK